MTVKAVEWAKLGFRGPPCWWGGHEVNLHVFFCYMFHG